MLELKMILLIGMYFIIHLPRQGTLSKQNLNNTHTELRYIESSVFMKKFNNQNLWNFEFGSHESVNALYI